MIGQVFADECGNEMIAVIVAFLHAQRDGPALFCIGRLQILREQLFGQKFVIGTLIDQYRNGAVPGLDQFGCIVGLPLFFIITQISAETTLTPGAFERDDRWVKRRKRNGRRLFPSVRRSMRRDHPWNAR